MSIISIEIKNCRSIKNLKLSLNEISMLVGQNGVGKSNIFKAIQYFYDNLTDSSLDKSMFDTKNPYCKFLEISFIYDLEKIGIKLKNLSRNMSIDDQLRRFINKFDYYKTIYFSDNECKLTMKQSRNNRIEWIINNNELSYYSPFDLGKRNSNLKETEKTAYEFRSLLKNMFPIYFIQARHINLTDWRLIWKIIGDLGKIRVGKSAEFDNRLEIALSDSNMLGERYKKILKTIRKSFEKSNIEVDRYELDELFSNIYKIQLSGERFSHNESKLDFYSDGINSFNYIKIFSNLVSNISKYKLKEPLLLIDEPEIGLYPKLVDELSETFISNNKNHQLFIATHSSRMVKNVLKSDSSTNIYHIALENGYTKMKQVSVLTDKKVKNRLTEHEASLYFSKAIFYVEGETELELFQNPNLIELFPVLKEVDISLGLANNSTLEASHPLKRNTNVPYLGLVDLDKIITYQSHNNKFTLVNKSPNPLASNNRFHNKEKYLYGIKRIKTYDLRIRILNILEKHTFKFKKNWYYIEFDLFTNLKEIINEYCQHYNIFTLDTTIEGSLINKDNYEKVYDWLVNRSERKHIKREIEQAYNYKTEVPYKITLLRLLHNGKYDNLKKMLGNKKDDNRNYKQVIEEGSPDMAIYDLIYGKGIKVAKTSGWVSDFLDDYFNNYITKHKDANIRRQIFKSDFKELYKLILLLEKKIY